MKERLPMRVLVRPFLRPSALLWHAAVLVWVLVSAVPAGAQATTDGMFVTVPNPLTSDGVNRIKNEITARRNSESRPIRTVVFDFNPTGPDQTPKDVTSTDFGACYSLGRYISSLKDLQTVAFVHAKVSGHTVLPALACKELVMSKDARIGEITGESVPALTGTEQSAYQDFFGKELQFAIVQKMFDKDVELIRGVTRQRDRIYIDKRKEQEAKTKWDAAAFDPGMLAPVGQVALFKADEAKALQLARATAETREEVAELYSLPPAILRDDVLQGRSPDAYRYTLKGDVDGAMRESVNRIIRDIKRKKGNVLILSLECGGNDLDAARALADDLRKAAEGDDAVLTIAYIPERAAAAATFLAFGCSNIVMSKRKETADPNHLEDTKEAQLGDFEAVFKSTKAGLTVQHRKSLKELVESQKYPGILVDGMFDKDLEIVQARRAKDATQKRLMSRADVEASKEEWVVERVIKPKGQYLKLTATLAGELGIARYVVDTSDPKELYSVYGLEPSKVKEATPGWLDRFAEFLRMPVVTVLLVVIGFTGLILELKVPGLTVPGIIAALCFILVFWAQSRFSGETFVLALLLFILGLVLVGLEIFVLPGFGAPGIFGVLCMLAGLGLVTFDKIPQTSEEWGGLAMKVSQYLMGMIGSFVLAFIIARFLPKVPYANRLMLGSPADKPDAAEPVLPGASEAAGLLGAVGTTNTPLRPAGVVRFGDKFVDVVSDGAFVPAGTRVQVIAVEGTRIVVKEV
jgi:membrane-bound ClpP family serine protease